MGDEWSGLERRKVNRIMEERLNKLENSFSILDKQLALLNAELPHLRESLDNTVSKISEHEEAMGERMGTYTKCRDERVKLTEGIKWVWLVVTVLLITNTGLLINVIFRK